MSKLICIVDDEDELVANLKIEIQALRPAWDIHTFSDGLKALQMIMSGKVDLVLTDIAMPDMDGYELFWRVKDYDANIPVIMMTGFGYDPNHVLVRAKVDGLKDVLFKPFDVEKLVELIDQKLATNGG
ncbi:MAG: response regulator [Candidatus Cloacimonadaceae bacterium]|jgi:DNA-binding NtrC family response regulator|nr:response regulator [Candidatus Cloacimonadota bacterium]MDD4668143.1 response regulator [Candidatus Cloacimonadota bacterium]MDY0337060.1 response regulator [Candidatus Cloacimonadaceae bacterium]HRX76678.1 response regulator [Candidatus Cloacimonadota bacterium]